MNRHEPKIRRFSFDPYRNEAVLIHIRPETPADYAAIAGVNARAFGRAAEAVIVDLLRHRARFDPELSLVAELDGRMVGHVLFSPQTIRLLGEDVETVSLAPIAVDPGHQREGVGGALIREGHDLAKTKGYALSYLLGHTTYYPRFGYRTGAYGASSLRVATGEFSVGSLEARPLADADIPALRDLWRREEGAVDFAVDPSDSLMEWLSPRPGVQALVYTRGGEIVGFARVEGAAARYFLARDGETARQMARSIGDAVEPPLHPGSASASALGTADASAWDAAMVCPFMPSPFDDYYAQVQAGTRLPGRVIWGVEFDLA